jgi:hypothetical protein
MRFWKSVFTFRFLTRTAQTSREAVSLKENWEHFEEQYREMITLLGNAEKATPAEHAKTILLTVRSKAERLYGELNTFIKMEGDAIEQSTYFSPFGIPVARWVAYGGALERLHKTCSFTRGAICGRVWVDASHFIAGA